MKLFWLVFVLVIFSSCVGMRGPHTPYSKFAPPPAPDYEVEDSWAALPNKNDPADLVPDSSLMRNGEATARVDVFYIHPTTYMGGRRWNAGIHDSKINKRTDYWPLRHQASVFNGSCRVYAPRYRQAALKAFWDKSGSGEQALNLAFEDVCRAFEYYLNHYNLGRPFIIAGHSQGGLMAYRLLEKYLTADSLKQRLVAAYIIGWPVNPDSLTVLSPCASSSETGCYLTWRTYKWGYVPKWTGEKTISVNPLNWKLDGTYAIYEENLGSLEPDFGSIIPGSVDAKTSSGVLWIHPDRLPGRLKLLRKNYHVLDFNLFWMNIRQNVALRVNEYLHAH